MRPDGRIAKLTLGPFVSSNDAEDEPAIGKPLTLAAARRLAGDVGHQRAMGRDVMSDQKVAKAEMLVKHRDRVVNNFGRAVEDFIAGHAKPKTRGWRGTAKLLGLTSDGEVVRGGLADRWGDRPLAEIDGGAIYSVVEEARQRGVPGMAAKGDKPSEARARHLHSALSSMFSWLHRHRRIDVNPIASVHPPDPGGSRDRVLSDAEIVKIWKAADAEPTFGPLLKLLLLTGCRLNEVSGMRRAEIDGKLWTVPGSRTKNHKAHVVPLAPMAQALIESKKTDFVFTTTGRSPLSGWSKLKLRLDEAMGDHVPPWRLHDLRRTAATGMAKIGILPHIIEAVLNHISGAQAGVAGIYNRATYLPEKTTALERWAAHVEGLVSGKMAKVVPLERRKRT